ncbi:DUF4232 domain-containing protein [Micromonospora sp. WMMA1363]|uniref:DUF4232 domain-containing protein n=1 Tax=Micromonospora sp. WMMA1363 TaxID=3053985 RepID=UPI00259C9BD6|nr:DUF4232 domain-containing protein [Micromonospora sp. WMMA1363]MDM4721077.1 DUF4232 domain-containing protein [Micromonospora sp. WMMA1363]
MLPRTPMPARQSAPSIAAAGAATAFLLAGCVATGTPAHDSATVPPSSVAPQGTPSADCPESGVRIRSRGVDAAMGLRAMGLELSNCGTRSYPLHGYPALRLRDGDNGPVPVRVVPGAKGITSGFDDPPRPLVLAPGERARATVLWRNLVTDPTVVATNAEQMEVAPGAGQPGQEVDTEGGIDLGNTGRIGVSPWKRRPPETPAPTAPTPTRGSSVDGTAVPDVSLL